MPLTAEWTFLWFLCYSFAGWVYESALVSAQERRWVNRGFLNGPLCPIYGVGAVLAAVLLTPLRAHPLLIFAISAIGASTLEYVTSWAMERLFHARWWDYSNFRFNLNGRICLLGAVVFGIAGVLIVEFVHPWVAALTWAMPLPTLHWLCFIAFVLVSCDCAVTVAGLDGFDRRLSALKEFVQAQVSKAGDTVQREGTAQREDAVQWGRGVFIDKLHDWTDAQHDFQDITDHLRRAAAGMLSRQQRRMIDVFPHFTTLENGKVIETLRELLRHKRH